MFKNWFNNLEIEKFVAFMFRIFIVLFFVSSSSSYCEEAVANVLSTTDKMVYTVVAAMFIAFFLYKGYYLAHPEIFLIPNGHLTIDEMLFFDQMSAIYGQTHDLGIVFNVISYSQYYVDYPRVYALFQEVVKLNQTLDLIEELNLYISSPNVDKKNVSAGLQSFLSAVELMQFGTEHQRYLYFRRLIRDCLRHNAAQAYKARPGNNPLVTLIWLGYNFYSHSKLLFTDNPRICLRAVNFLVYDKYQWLYRYLCLPEKPLQILYKKILELSEKYFK